MRPPFGSLLVALVVALSVSSPSWASGPEGARPHGSKTGRAVSRKMHTRRGATAAVARKAPPPPPAVPADSVGSPNQGKLVGGVHLDTSRPELRVVPSHTSGDVRWGLPALVHLIERAAHGVAKRYPGSVLDVGDLSKKGGGEVARHHSHESGRDADLGFYVVDGQNKQIHAHGFLKIDAALKATSVPGARFDVGRNWALVEMLVTDPHARVTHIFVAEPLRQALLAQARARGVSQVVFDRAAIALMQPRNSLPHDDHMHVRISCPRGTRDRCVEFAKNAPTGHARGAQARAVRRHPVLRTPPPHARHDAGQRAGLGAPLPRPERATPVRAVQSAPLRAAGSESGQPDRASPAEPDEPNDALGETDVPKIID